MDNIDKYLELTGQDFQYLMSGAMQYGPGLIDVLVDQALEENKKIVWTTRLVDGEDLGLVNYELQPL